MDDAAIQQAFADDPNNARTAQYAQAEMADGRHREASSLKATETDC